MDPFAITAMERARHAEQFASLGPVAGFVTGAQAKGFFMQSGLPPVVLAQIWGLADLNGDGRMDLNEFSVACKLINLKLKGFELPATLPPSILVVPQMPAVSGVMTTSIVPPMGMHVPVVSTMGAAPPLIANASMIPQTAPVMAQPMVVQAPGAVPPPVVASPVTSEGHVDASGGSWAVPLTAQSKYGAVFAQTDKARTGFLAGPQARNILLQSGLPQNILAQIWSLSDIDKDGRLNRDEFIVSGHLCDLASKGEPLPNVLPTALIPPSHRPVGSSDSVSTPGSVHGDSFEDKRRENFNKGQAELERRRQSLIEQQKREEEERKRKEKEEAEEKERQKKELERKRLQEWEKQRKDELTQHRQREQDKLLQLKARQANLNKELDAARDKVKELTTGISESRTGVSDVKTFIDGMRNSRDEKMQEMNNLKSKLKEQNERLLIVTQEKAQLEAKNRANASKIANGPGPELTDFEIKVQEKEQEIESLKKDFEAVQEKKNETSAKHAQIKEALDSHREDLERIIESCKELYSSFDEKRRELKAEKAKYIRELTDPDHAWGNEEPEPQQEEAPPAVSEEPAGQEIKYRALYDYDAMNDDEITFRTGDILFGHEGVAGEPGWVSARLNDKIGWIPKDYVEIFSGEDAVVASSEPVTDGALDAQGARVLFDWPTDSEFGLPLVKNATVEISAQPEGDWWYGKSEGKEGFFPKSYVFLGPAGEAPSEPPAHVGELAPLKYRALHPYAAQQEGDLSFEAGEEIEVTNMEAQWWTGRIGSDRSGVFPFNYVEQLTVNADAPLQQEASAEVAQQEDAVVARETVNTLSAAAPVAKGSTGSMKKSKKKKKDDGEGGKKKPLIARVVAPYEATSKEQLSLAQGQLILVRKKADTGWWQGEIQGDKGKKRQVGWFPASFVKLNEPTGAAAPSAGATAAQGAGAGAAVAAAAVAEEWYRALFDYSGQQDDELSFKEGEVIKLISKEDSVWWKGELEGKAGLFPSNYVEATVKP